MTEIAIRQNSSLAITEDQDGFSAKQVAALRQIGVEDATQGDLDVFFYQCKRTGLDPFAKQIYLIGRKSKGQMKFTIQTGIDGFRLVARRAADQARASIAYEDTLWCGEDGVWRDVWVSSRPPVAAKSVVIRGGERIPATAHYAEYVQTNYDGSPNQMWSRMAANQLAKCAEALALRKAFPQDLSGIYTTDEMGQSENSIERRQQQSAKPANIRDAIGVPSVRSDAQSKKLAILLRELGMTDRTEALAYIGGVVGRDVDSTKTLTVAEASTLIDHLERVRVDANTDKETGEILEAELEPEDGWSDVETAAVPR